MKPTLFHHECHLAINSVTEGAKIITEYNPNTISRKSNSNRDIATNIDIKIDEIIKDILLETNYEILSEESCANSGILDMDKNVWFVDPIDGTVNYVSGLPIFGISVGLMVNKKFKIGSIYAPMLNEIYYTTAFDESYMNKKLLMNESVYDLNNCLVGMNLPYATYPDYDNAIQVFSMIDKRSRGCLRLGSAAISLAFLASGRLQAVVGFKNKLWDVAAGIALSECSGFKSIYRIDYNNLEITYVVGSGPSFQKIIDIINSSCDEFNL